MPTYEYHCDACGHDFEQFHSITAAPIKKCPKCGKLKVRRLIGTGAGMIFKGSGFYITDYRSEGYEKAAKAESGANGSGGGGDAKGGESGAKGEPAKTESKPAAEAPKSTLAKTESKPAAKAPASKKSSSLTRFV